MTYRSADKKKKILLDRGTASTVFYVLSAHGRAT